MNVFKIGWRNLLNKPLSTFLSVMLLTMGVALISFLLLINKQLQEKFTKNIRGIDMVIGAKGSPLQLILSSVYQIDYPTGNINLNEVNTFVKNPLIKETIPLAYGDSFDGYRIVGTTEKYVQHYGAKLQNGHLWQHTFEATVGATVAEMKGLKVGDTFFSAHGLLDEGVEGAEVHDNHAYKVVGVLERNNSVVDQLILTAIESIWNAHDDHNHGEDNHAHVTEDAHNHDETNHAHDHGEDNHAHATEDAHDHGEDAHNHDETNHAHATEDAHDHGEENHNHDETNHAHATEDKHKHNKNTHNTKVSNTTEVAADRDITAMFIKFRSPMGMVSLPRKVNEQTSMQAAVPAIEVNRLFGLMGIGVDALRSIALAIMLIAGISVFISLYNSLKERQYEMALMRSMGASRYTLFVMVMLESLLLSVAGFVVGIVLGRLGMWLMANMVRDSFHYDLTVLKFMPEEGVLLVVTLLVGFLAALLPARQAFNTNISKTLANA